MSTKIAQRATFAIAVIVLFILLLLGGEMLSLHKSRRIYSFKASDKSFGNPFMGYAPCAWYESVGDDINLLYMDITWRELEPSEGIFDWETIERENQLERWRREGKHIVLRFVCDIPDDEQHRDIPDWLYEKIGGAGTEYANDYGCGFSPDYANREFIECHKRAVKALGERYGGDCFIAYIELGSLGHWGEWHVDSSAGIDKLPLKDVRREYVQHWIDAFPNAHIMMRRPFTEASEYKLGLFNDMSGHLEATESWLEWIRHGGEYDQTGEKDAIVPMPDAWKVSPIGGELTSSLEMSEMLVDRIDMTKRLIRESHTTFLGPKIADRTYQDGYASLLASMGYRINISEATFSGRLFGGVTLTLQWENHGSAPLYFDLPVNIYVLDSDFNEVDAIELDIDLTKLIPGEQIKTKTFISMLESTEQLDDYSIMLGITDPMIGKCCVRFDVSDAMQFEGKMLINEKIN